MHQKLDRGEDLCRGQQKCKQGSADERYDLSCSLRLQSLGYGVQAHCHNRVDPVLNPGEEHHGDA